MQPQFPIRRPGVPETFVIAAALLLLVGCRVGPDYRPTQTPVPTEWHQSLEGGQAATNDQLCQWWHLFNDPYLTTLIECAADYNLELSAAYHRITQARARRCVADANRYPTIARTGQFTRTKQSANGIGIGGIPGLVLDPFSLIGSNLDVAWEPDFWGKVARQVEAADANVCGSIEAFRGIMVMLYGDVASSYVQIRATQDRIRYAQQNIGLLERALDIATKKVAAGKAPNLDQFQAEANLAAARAEIPTLEKQLHQELNRLSVLVGHYPGSLHECLADDSFIPSIESSVPIVFPCDVVRQRPDIREAERTVAARTAEIGVSTAQLYPSFQFNGSIGLSAQRPGDLLSADSLGYTFGPSFNWPMFQGGRIKCGICEAEAALEEAIATYEQTVLRAFEEIENAIVCYNKEKERRDALRQSIQSAQKSLESVLEQYKAGKVDFQNVLSNLQTLFNAQTNLAVSQGDIAKQLIILYRALGGGWETNAHCEKRCTRLHCPERGHPSLVEDLPVDDSGGKYFEQRSSRDDASAQPEKPKAATDSSGDEDKQDDSSDSQETREFFDRQLKDLEERLKSTPNRQSPSEESPAVRDDLPEPPAEIRRRGSSTKSPPALLQDPSSSTTGGALPDASFSPIVTPAIPPQY